MKKDITFGAREFLPRIQADILQRFPIVSVFLLGMFILKFAFNFPLPNPLLYLASLSALISIPVDLIVRKLKDRAPNIAVNFYFLFLLFDLILLTAIIYFFGGITWIAPGIFLFYTVTIFWVLPFGQAIFFIGWASFLLIFLVVFQYFGILGQSQIFLPGEKNPRNFSYLLITTIGGLAILGFLGYTTDEFYQLLAKKIKELKNAQRRLISTRKFLEKELKEKTAQLEKEKERLEKEVTDKTRKLQERKNALEIKVLELEKFYKLAVSKELEIVKLKEEISKLKEFQK